MPRALVAYIVAAVIVAAALAALWLPAVAVPTGMVLALLVMRSWAGACGRGPRTRTGW